MHLEVPVSPIHSCFEHGIRTMLPTDHTRRSNYRRHPVMSPAAPCLLTINGASWSIKFALFEPEHSLRRILQGEIARTGLPGATFQVEGLEAKRLNDLVNLQSGLLGISEASSNMRDLLDRESHDVRAAEAVEIFCYQVKKWIVAFAAALGGLDALVLADGIGEHAPAVRARTCAGLEFLGVELDAARNVANEGVISTTASRVSVRVMRTDDVITIARAVCCVRGLGAKDPKEPMR